MSALGIELGCPQWQSSQWQSLLKLSVTIRFDRVRQTLYYGTPIAVLVVFTFNTSWTNVAVNEKFNLGFNSSTISSWSTIQPIDYLLHTLDMIRAYKRHLRTFNSFFSLERNFHFFHQCYIQNGVLNITELFRFIRISTTTCCSYNFMCIIFVWRFPLWKKMEKYAIWNPHLKACIEIQRLFIKLAS